MELRLERYIKSPQRTIGRLYVDDRFQCFMCEDAVRPPGVKVHGQTAIPYGRYQIVITMSNRFKVELPLLVNVPNYEGIRIHPGNTELNTEGCLLPGQSLMSNDAGVANSRLAFNALNSKLRIAILQVRESCWINVCDADAVMTTT